MYLLFDGGNGGHLENKGYGSFILRDKRTDAILYHSPIIRYDGFMTNNEAEYHTLITALKYIRATYPKEQEIIIEGDSELVRNQVMNKWRVKHNHLKPLCTMAQELLEQFTIVGYNHVPRKYVVAVLGH